MRSTGAMPNDYFARPRPLAPSAEPAAPPPPRVDTPSADPPTDASPTADGTPDGDREPPALDLDALFAEVHRSPNRAPPTLLAWAGRAQHAPAWRPAFSRSTRAVMAGSAAVLIAWGGLATGLLRALHPLLGWTTPVALVAGLVAVGLGIVGARDRAPGDPLGRVGQFAAATALALTGVGLPAALGQFGTLLGWRSPRSPARWRPNHWVVTVMGVLGLVAAGGVVLLGWLFVDLWCTFMC